MKENTVKRVFTGLTIHEGVRSLLDKLARTLRDSESSFRTVGILPNDKPETQLENPHDYHITLNYLGNMTPEQKGIIQRITKETAMSTPTFDLTLDSLELFAAQDRNALVATVKSPTGARELHKLQKALEEKLEARGFEPNQFQYKPHITIAKTHLGRDTLQTFYPLQKPIHDPPIWTAQSLAIFRSNTGSMDTKYVQTNGWSLA